jgi:filamentous hemagglutinin
MATTENLPLASTTIEDHFDSKNRHVTIEQDHVSQVSTVVTAGGWCASTPSSDKMQ